MGAEAGTDVQRTQDTLAEHQRLQLYGTRRAIDTVFVGEMSVAPKRHISQLIKERFVGSHCKLVEDLFEFAIPPEMYMQTVFPCFGFLVGCSQSVAENSIA